MAALRGLPLERPPVLPILHSGLPSLFGVSLGDYFISARVMSDVLVRGLRTFGYDGVQLSLGVTGEAEALGAFVEQPADSAPILRQALLADAFTLPKAALVTRLSALGEIDATGRGRMPLFYEAVQRTVEQTEGEAFVLATLRGPLLAASQLCGVEALLMGMIDHPQVVAEILAFTSRLILELGRWLRGSGAHGLVLGEATCSPNFISPALYRQLVARHHCSLVRGLHAAGWQVVGLHICGGILPILEDIIATGVDFLDVDYQVPAERAIAVSGGRVALRGNLDPSGVLRFGSVQTVADSTHALLEAVDECPRWIVSSGCDIPPQTPWSAVETLVGTVRSYHRHHSSQKERGESI